MGTGIITAQEGVPGRVFQVRTVYLTENESSGFMGYAGRATRPKRRRVRQRPSARCMTLDCLARLFPAAPGDECDDDNYDDDAGHHQNDDDPPLATDSCDTDSSFSFATLSSPVSSTATTTTTTTANDYGLTSSSITVSSTRSTEASLEFPRLETCLDAGSAVYFSSGASSTTSSTASPRAGAAAVAAVSSLRRRHVTATRNHHASPKKKNAVVRLIDSIGRQGAHPLYMHGSFIVEIPTVFRDKVLETATRGHERKPCFAVSRMYLPGCSSGGEAAAAATGNGVSTADEKELFQRITLSDDGVSLRDTPNAGGASVRSEVMSMEVLKRTFGATLRATEMQVWYYPPNGPITDYVCEINGEILGVSVTRAFNFADPDAFTPESARHLLNKKLQGVINSTNNVLFPGFTRQILHVFCHSARVARTLAEQYRCVRSEKRANTIVLLTICDADWIYTERLYLEKKVPVPKTERRTHRLVINGDGDEVLEEIKPKKKPKKPIPASMFPTGRRARKRTLRIKNRKRLWFLWWCWYRVKDAARVTARFAVPPLWACAVFLYSMAAWLMCVVKSSLFSI